LVLYERTSEGEGYIIGGHHVFTLKLSNFLGKLSAFTGILPKKPERFQAQVVYFINDRGATCGQKRKNSAFQKPCLV